MRALVTRPHPASSRPPCSVARPAQHQRADLPRRGAVQAAAAAWRDDWAFKRLMFLPGTSGGAWFVADADTEAPVYGDSFVMHQRPSPGWRGAGPAATGLVRQRQRAATAVLRRPQQPTDIVPLRLDEVEVSMVVLQPASAADLSSSSSSSSVVPFRRLLAAPGDKGGSSEDSGSSGSGSGGSGSASLAIVPRDSTMFGMVMSAAVRRRDDEAPLPPDEAVYETPFNDKNPRRTMKIKFKCKRCSATTIKPINPHAWASGTVFAKCGCCNVTHKLIDNLKLFHELSGPCFGPGTQAPPAPKRERLGLRLDSDTPPPLRLRLPLLGRIFPEDTAGLN